MVCYCPLSVLSVPESILNEGQLHLAAIFQLSHSCHGDVVVFSLNLAASSGAEQGKEGQAGRGGHSPQVRGHCRTATATTPFLCRGLMIGSVHCSGFHGCSQLSLHPPAFLITLHPSLCDDNNSFFFIPLQQQLEAIGSYWKQ